MTGIVTALLDGGATYLSHLSRGIPDASTLPVKTPLVVAADNCTTFSSGLRRTRTRSVHPWGEGSPSFTPFR